MDKFEHLYPNTKLLLVYLQNIALTFRLRHRVHQATRLIPLHRVLFIPVESHEEQHCNLSQMLTKSPGRRAAVSLKIQHPRHARTRRPDYHLLCKCQLQGEVLSICRPVHPNLIRVNRLPDSNLDTMEAVLSTCSYIVESYVRLFDYIKLWLLK